MLSILLQLVEYLEEGILCANLVRKLLNIVYNEHIHHHVEVQEVCKLILYCNGIHILSTESVGAYIEHYLLRISLLYCYAYCLRKVCLSKPRTSINEDWVEGVLSRLLCNGETCCSGKPVALTLYKIVEVVVGVKLRIYLKLLQARNNERIGYSS